MFTLPSFYYEGAVAAVAFLSIASQVTAAPIAPSATEDDASYLLEKYDAKHLILFEGVDYAGLDAIAAKMLASGKMKVHRAKVRADGKPGIFDFVERENVAIDGLWTPESSASEALVNPSDGIGLLLSTSGTTSKPKGVPVKHGALVNNGEIIGSNLRLTPDDTCYSVMPLFHIGGIAASIMCTMAMGSSVCCDGGGYNPERMVDALALSNPQPTWYSSVPTIHNSTVGFIKAMAERYTSRLWYKQGRNLEKGPLFEIYQIRCSSVASSRRNSSYNDLWRHSHYPFIFNV